MAETTSLTFCLLPTTSRPPSVVTSSRLSGTRSEERRVGKECRSRCDWSSDVCSSDLDSRLIHGGNDIANFLLIAHDIEAALGRHLFTAFRHKAHRIRFQLEGELRS